MNALMTNPAHGFIANGHSLRTVGTPLFRDAQQAVGFAFAADGAAHVPRSPMSRMASSPSKQGRFDSMADSAAQSGMIRGLLHRGLDDLHLAILLCRCARRTKPCDCHKECCLGYVDNPEHVACVEFLSDVSIVALSGLLSPRGLRGAVIRKYFSAESGQSERVDREWSKRFQVPRELVTAHTANITRWLRGDANTVGVEDRAWREAESLLTETGII